MELLETTENSFRIHVFAENGTAIARVSPAPSWWEPQEGEPFGGESLVILGKFKRFIIDVSATSTLTAGENARLVKGVTALKARTGSNVVINGVPWRSAWIEAGFPVFASLQAAIDCSGNLKEIAANADLCLLPQRSDQRPASVVHRLANPADHRRNAVSMRCSTGLSRSLYIMFFNIWRLRPHFRKAASKAWTGNPTMKLLPYRVKPPPRGAEVFTDLYDPPVGSPTQRLGRGQAEVLAD